MAEIGKPSHITSAAIGAGWRAKAAALPGVTAIAPRTRTRLAIVLIAAAALLFPILHKNDADIDSAANALSFAALALGLNIVVGFAGLLDLGYAAFFAIGAYAYGILSSFQLQPEWTSFWEPFRWLDLVARMPGANGGDVVHFQVSFWLMLPVSAAIAAFCGVLFGAPTLRLKGDYLAIVTLGFGEIVPIVVRNTPSLTNGAMGLNGVAAPQLFGFNFGVSATPYYYVGVALVALLMLTSFRLKDSRIGRAWMAIREDEIAAAAMGVNRVRFKLLAFATGAAFAGATGTLYVAKLQTATPDMFMFPVSVMILVMIVFGGIGSVWGVVVGALLLQMLQSWFLEDLSQWLHALGRLIDVGWLQHVELASSIELIFGLILVLMMLYRRDGLIPATRRTPALTLDQQSAQVERGGFRAAQLFGAADDNPAPATRPLLEISGLTVSFGGLVALRSVSLSVPSHSVVAVIGPNGSGKSTLFNAVTGLVTPEAGSVRFAGAEIARLPPHRVLECGIARTFQNIRLFPNLTVLENVMIGMHARLHTGAAGALLRLPRMRREEDDARERALEILALFGNRLLPRADHLAASLSYANRRRTEIARALASRPRLLLLDEPTAGMNPAETLELAEQIKSLHEAGLTIVLIEHKLDVVVSLAKTVVVLDHGEKIAEGPPETVRRDEEVIRAYLGRSAAFA
ncbi:MAG TPA: branched-chain amino acid ABC transporter ATP-binding protein/permease [Stellaceae bacterium]